MATFKVATLLQLHLLLIHGSLIPDEQQQFAGCLICHCNITRLMADCSNRSLSAVQENLPHYIQYLNLNNNSLTSISAMSFINYRNLTNLTMERNKLNLLEDVYDQNAFFGLDKLEELKIGWNCNYNTDSSLLYSYPDLALEKLPSLRVLYIDGIPKATFGKGFQNLSKLQNIEFNGLCYLQYISKDMFNNTPNLLYLNMSDCDIYDIHRDAFLPLSSIDILDISKNPKLGLENVTASTCGLKGSSIRGLYMNKVVMPFSVGVTVKNNTFVCLKNTNITELYADHNWIESLEPGTLKHYPNSLSTLSVKDNRFTVGGYFSETLHMKGLKNIDVSDMAILHKFLPSETLGYRDSHIYGPPNLEVVTARKYVLGGSIPEMHIDVGNKTSLDISQNTITEWIGPVHYFQSLERADFSGCFCSKIHFNFFSSFPNLIFLNVSFNLIGAVLKKDSNGSLFQNLTSLKVLDLSMNRIKYLSRNLFAYNCKLEYLNLSNNELNYWTLEIAHLKSLVNIDVHHNEIRTMHSYYRNALDTCLGNVSLDLSGNPLQCTCENINFLKWFSNTKIDLGNRYSYNCIDADDEKAHMNRVFISTMESKCTSVFGYIIAGLAGIVLFLSVSVMGLVYRYRWKLKYLYYGARDRYYHRRGQGVEERYYEFDAFVSCSDENLEFVDELLSHLEGQGKRLCVHHRDFRPGEPIAANIVKAVQKSRRTLIVLSSHFLSSTWCRYEYEMAKMESVHEGRNVILVVKIGEIDSADIPRELMYMMRTDSYAEFPERMEDQSAFWITLNAAI